MTSPTAAYPSGERGPSQQEDDVAETVDPSDYGRWKMHKFKAMARELLLPTAQEKEAKQSQEQDPYADYQQPRMMGNEEGANGTISQ